MTNLLRTVLIIYIFAASTSLILCQKQDNVDGAVIIEVPQDVKNLLNQIRDAENNEDWQSYNLLREQRIQKLQKTNPELAKRYNTVNTKTETISNRDGC